MNIFDINLMKTDVVVDNKDKLFEMMVSDLYQNQIIEEIDGFLKAVITRETSLSTGVGHGIGIPHGRHSCVKELKAVVYTLSEGVHYDALDGLLVNIIFMVAIPIEATNEYMKMLGTISKAMHNSDNRSFLLRSNNSEEILNFLKGI